MRCAVTKNKKPIILICSVLLVALLVGIILIVYHLNDENEYEKQPDGPGHRESISAEIIEINADGTIIVKCTKDRTQLVNKDDMIKLKVGRIYACLVEEGDDISDKYEMQVGDIINIGFWEEDLEKQNDQHYIDLEKNNITLEVYFTDYENRIFR